jgi:hypothetical protein
VALLGDVAADSGRLPVRFLMLPPHPVPPPGEQVEGPSDEDLKEFVDLKREIEHSIAGIKRSGLDPDPDARALARAASAWFSGDHAAALEEIRACGAAVERKLESLTPSVRCAIHLPKLGVRVGKDARFGVELTNRAEAAAADVRLVVTGAGYERGFTVAVLKSGGTKREELDLRFPEPGDAPVTAQVKYRRVFDAREYESVAVELVTVESTKPVSRGRQRDRP